VLPAVDAGVKEMKRGEVSFFTAPASWAYASPEYETPLVDVSAESDGPAVGGAEAVTGVVPPPTDRSSVGDVEVQVELIDFERGKDVFSMTGAEKLVKQGMYRKQGNKYYQVGEHKRAIKKYEEANRFEVSDKNLENDGVSERDAPLAETKQNMVSCYLNIAMCHIKLGDSKQAERSCTEAIKKDELNFKALFRRGQVRLTLGDIDGARSDLYEAARKEPQNKEVRKELEALKKMEQKLKQEQKGMFGGIFANK